MAVIEEVHRDSAIAPADGPLLVAGVEYSSRLLVGTGKYRDFEETRRAIEASGAQIVTVAIRRTNLGRMPTSPTSWIFFPRTDTRFCRTPPVVMTHVRRCVPAGSRASFSMVTI